MGSGRARSVGIILRTRDRPLLLPRALGSILGQSHEAWRLYLVNDGGDAGELDAQLAPYAAALRGRLERIDRTGPPGLMAAAREGLDRVGEDLVVLHDDDDSWEPGFLATVTGFLDDPAHAGHVAVSTGCTLIEEEIRDGVVRERWRCPWPHGRGTVELRRALVDAQIPPISLAFRRAALACVGGYDPTIRYAGDWEFLLRLLLVGEIGHVPVPLANYHHRVRGSGDTYGNSVVEAIPARQEQMIRLRNAMLRAGLEHRPELLGLTQALLSAIAERDPRDRLSEIDATLSAAAERAAAAERTRAADMAALHAAVAALAARVEQLDAGLAETRQVSRAQGHALRPLRWAWRQALPARAWIAWARGRAPAPTAMPRAIDLPVFGPWLVRRRMLRRATAFLGYVPQIDPPRGFNDHVIARILRDRDPRLPMLCDKLAARELVRTTLGEELLVPLIGAWADPSEVPWDNLPLPFVMKPNHASGLVHFVTRKEEVVPGYLAALAAGWLARDYFDTTLEWGYRGLPRRLMVEPLLRGPDGGTPAESQVFVFGGRAAFVRIYTGGMAADQRTDNWFDRDGRRQPIALTTPIGDYQLDPALARQLAEMAERMASDYDHLRVDFYLTADGVKAGELTPYNRAGMALWQTREMDLWLGRLWDEGAARLRAARHG